MKTSVWLGEIGAARKQNEAGAFLIDDTNVFFSLSCTLVPWLLDNCHGIDTLSVEPEANKTRVFNVYSAYIH